MRKLAVAVFVTFFAIASSTVTVASEEPQISIEQALLLAKQHLTTAKIDVTDHYIAKAEWQVRFGVLSYWLIEWRTKRLVKGGQLYVKIYADGKIEHTFGE